MRWDFFAVGVIAILLVIWVGQLRKRLWSWTGLYVSVGCMVCAGLNAAAPFRGVIDPDYVGYSFGWLRAEAGIMVPLVVGPIFVASAISALLAAGRTTGPSLWFVAFTCAVLSLVVGIPTGIDVLSDPAAFRIELGEYFTVPGFVASAIILALITLPFLVGTVWASRNARAA